MKLKAIIVDDEPLARKGLLIRLAEFADVDVIAQCHNGVSALEVIKQEKPRLVFLDIQMPGMTGFDVMKKIRALEGDIANVPIIVITGKSAMKKYFVYQRFLLFL